MPKELRKRGKKFKKGPDEDVELELIPAPTPEPAILPEAPLANLADLPFGELPNEVKAYFRSVDVQLRDWEGDAEGLIQTQKFATQWGY